MLRVLGIPLLLLAVAFAGCADDAELVPLSSVDQDAPGGAGSGDGTGTPGVETEQPPAPEGTPTMTVSGVVQDEDTQPIEGATVTLLALNRTRVTDAAGAFVFENVPLGFHVVRADATDFTAAEVTAKPEGEGETASVFVVLPRFAEEPFHETVHFQGIVQCAAEYAIISPSCDTPIEYAGGPSLTDNETIFIHSLAANWRTVVLDVDFDAADHPGMDGLRITVRGTNDADQVNEYDQYARFHGATSYRIEPGGTYEDGTGPVPADSATFEYEVYPHSHGYHPGGAGLLGVGVGLDVTFDLYATAFYVDGAEAGWSTLA